VRRSAREAAGAKADRHTVAANSMGWRVRREPSRKDWRPGATDWRKEENCQREQRWH